MTAAVEESFLRTALDAVTGGGNALALFQQAGFTGLGTLLKFHTSFTAGAPDASEVAKMEAALRAAGAAGGFTWPAAKQTKALTAILIKAHSLAPALASITAATPFVSTGPVASAAALSSGVPTAVSTAAATAKVGAAQYAEAIVVFNNDYKASARIKYSTVGTLYNAYTENTPVAYALADYNLQLQVKSANADTFEFMGQTWANEEGASKKVAVSCWEHMDQQMMRRAEAKSVAGCFSAGAAATKRGAPVPTGDKVRATSSVNYVRVGAKGVLAGHVLDCFATEAGQKVQVDAMRDFRKKHSHLPLATLMYVDAKIEAHIADLQAEEYTLDAAVYAVCRKSPELYSSAMLEAPAAKAEKPGGAAGEGDTTAAAEKKRSRTPEETETAMKNRLEQKDREIANLKYGKKGGKGRGKGGAPYAPAWQQQWQPAWQPSWPQWQPGKGAQGKGGGPPGRTPCPPDVCRDFNFKVTGCARPNCTYKHVCAACGANHPHTGNH